MQMALDTKRKEDTCQLAGQPFNCPGPFPALRGVREVLAFKAGLHLNQGGTAWNNLAPRPCLPKWQAGVRGFFIFGRSQKAPFAPRPTCFPCRGCPLWGGNLCFLVFSLNMGLFPSPKPCISAPFVRFFTLFSILPHPPNLAAGARC